MRMPAWLPLVAAWLGAARALDAAPGAGERALAPQPAAGAGDEEARAACAPGEFPCASGARCLPAAWRCDGRAHCADGEDEIDCQWNTTCGEGQFRCARSGRCIAASWRCDGDEDCGPHDRSDEEPHLCEREATCGAGRARCLAPLDGRVQCVPVERFCDGGRDCLDGSDEGDICDDFTAATACATLRCAGAAACRPTHAGLACYCPAGYAPAEGARCLDVDECAERREDGGDPCAQTCRNTAGSFSCGCVPGYALREDGRACAALNDPAGEPLSLLVVTQADVRRVWPAGAPSQPPANRTLPALNVRAIDFLYDNRSICYVHHNMSKSGIVCVDADDFSVRRHLPAPPLFPDLDSVSHLALDWVSGNWYFGDEREVVYVCRHALDVCRLVLDGELSKVRGLAVDPAAGLMFISVWGGSRASVSRATLAGDARAPLAALKLVYPGAITLDLAARRVYWADSYLETVERAEYDGSRRRTVHRAYLTQQLHHIALLEETLYLPLFGERALLAVSTARAPAPGGARTPLGARPVAALAFHRARQPRGAACRGGGPCSHLCVPTGEGGARCLCPAGLRLAGAHRCVPVRLDPYLVVARGTPPLVQALPLGGGGGGGAHAGWEAAAPATAAARPAAVAVDQRASYLYYCDVHRYEIVRQKLDGSAREVFVGEDVDNCEGLAVDWMGGNLYWTDSALGEVSVCRLDAARERAVVARHEHGSPRALALDPAQGDMYWTVWARGDAGGGEPVGRVETARMDGSRRRVLVASALRWPSGVALHAGALYWTDTFLDKIERLVLATGARELVTRAAKPYGLAVYEGAVIWSEHASGEIRRLAPAGSAETLHRLPPPLYDLEVVSRGDALGENACSAARGGCAHLCLASGPGTRVCAGGAPAGAAPPRPRCPAGQLACARGPCVDALYACDGDADCPDGSDEDASPTGLCANVTCAAERYLQCDGVRCVPRAWACDGLADCADGGDEAGPACGARACRADQWPCARSRRCLPAAWRCDGAPDCGDADDSDERGCAPPADPACAPDHFRCASGACLPWQYYCDGRADCADASDERGCDPADPEPTPRPRTRTHTNTIERHGSVCLEHEMQCNSSECVPAAARCDGAPHCLDASDEAGCPAPAPSPAPAPAPAPAPPPAACAAPALACDNATRCVPLGAQCDARADCADGADEAGRCGEPMCAVSACSHGCAPTPAGPACTCPATLRLQRDGTTCGARHACAEWGVCSQRCTPHKHRVRCACDPGYRLADDGFTCKSTVGGVPLLVFSSRHEVRGVELAGAGAGAGGGGARALVTSLKNAVAVEWASGEGGAAPRLYWTDVVDETIYSGELTLPAPGSGGGGGEAAVSDVRAAVEGGLGAAEGLAVDWVARNLYWVESGVRRVEVARLDGRHRRTLVAGGGMEAPRALAADPAAALLFWSDWEAGAPRVERCSLAGAARRVVVRVDALAAGAWPNGVALDARARRLYWADARTDSVHTTTYEGGDHRLVLAGHAALAHPFALAVFDAHVYWTDWRANAVVRANKWNGSDVVVVQRTLAQPFDLTVVHASRQPPVPAGENPCAGGGGCSHLCLLAGAGARVCACPHLMRLAADARTCRPHERALLVATPGEVLCVDVDSGEWACYGAGGAMCAEPRHLAVVAGAGEEGAGVAWADGAAGEVRRAPLGGGRALALGEGSAVAGGAGGLLYRAVGEWVVAGDARGERTAWLRGALPGVGALAADARRGRLYLARETPAGARLEAADGDGERLRVLRTAADDPLLAGVTGLAVDEEADRLYWVNTGSNSIQYMEVASGQTRTVALGAGARPTALALDAGRLLWADAGARALRSCGRHPHAACDAVLRRDTGAVLALRVFDARAAPPPAACAARAPPCAHLCLEAGGRAACRCAAGYALAPDGAACHVAGPLLAYSLGWELRALPLPGAHLSAAGALAPRLGAAQAVALAYSPPDEWVFWADGEAGGVWRVRRDGTERGRVAAAPAVAGLAVDWVARVVYWGSATRRAVLAARYDGGAAQAVLDTAPAAPAALALDAPRGYLFVRAAPWLQHTRLDGSDRRLLRQHDHMSALALDTQEQRAYWVEGWEGQVMSAAYPARAGGEARAEARLAHPVALAPLAGTLYWLDTQAARGAVLAAPLANLSAARVVAGDLGDGLLALSVWPAPAPAPATPHNKTCSDARCSSGALCLYDGAHGRCVCAHGRLAPDRRSCTPYESFVVYACVSEIATLHLDEREALNAPFPPIHDKELMRNVIAVAYSHEEGVVYYSDITRGVIGAARLGGAGAGAGAGAGETLVAGVGAVEGLVYAAGERALYWTSAGAGAVVRAEVGALRAAPPGERAALPAPVVRLAAGARPRGLDLDPCERRLYWADWGGSAGVRRAHPGRAPQTVVGAGVLMPNGLALDHAARWLYWADARLDRVERAHYDGSHRSLVASTGADHPFGVAAAGGRVYWTEWVSRAVYVASGAGGEVRRLVSTPHRPMSIVAVLPDHQTCGSDPCAVLNGGCAEVCRADGARHAVCACGAGRRLAGDGRGCAPAPGACPRGQFACAEGGCVPEPLVCDGVPHCSADAATASDENLYYCTSRACPAEYVRCGAGGRCVAASARCDGRVDCDDGSDERGCACPAGALRCDDGACVPAAARCDLRADCADASDERGCGHAACAALGATALRCATDGCYLPAWRCDGARDCPAGDDEANCTFVPPTVAVGTRAEEEAEPCGAGEFSCGGRECVPLAWLCDGRVDCASGADEAAGCARGAGAGAMEVGCGAGRWRCGARAVCVGAGERCDGRADCPAAEDEAGCCDPPAIPCGDTCFAPELYCDGDRDCEDGSDEPAGCARVPHNATTAPPAPAPPPPAGPCGGGVACAGRCVTRALVCDGRDHCEDGGGGGAGTDEDPLLCSTFASAVGAGGSTGAGAAACPGGAWRCGNEACVARDKLCDGHDDCGDYTDEWSCNVNECGTQNGGCAHNCTELAVGRACWCRAGWRRVPGTHDSCRDVDECEEDAPCEHECRNTAGSFACSCQAGFALLADGVSCAPAGGAAPAALLLTNRYYIRRVPLDGSASSLLAHNLTNAVALDYSWTEGCVYWSDVTRGGSALRRACPAGGPPTTLHAATTQNPDGLAVDWVAGNLYWGDKGTDTIEASRLDGRHRRVVVGAGAGLSEPRALALLPARGWLYWSDWGARAHIGRAGMDGSGPHARLPARLGWPNALTVAAGRLYFADARDDYVAEADLELRGARVLLARADLPHLRLHHAFALQAWAGRLYWSDWETRAVESCRRRPLRPAHPAHPANRTAPALADAYDCRTLLHTVHKPMDLRVFHPARQPPHPELTAACAALQCEGLCLLAPSADGAGAQARCACPEHWVLQPDGRSCRDNCTAAHFVCRAALKCIPFWWVCDTADDCGDGADEAGACPPFRCRAGQFPCAEGRCLHPARVCDGAAQCAGGEDERACAEWSCLAGQWACAGAAPRCVPAAARCDGRADCAGGEDEAGCACAAGQLPCAGGGCVPAVWACDADRDCADGSDEGPHCATAVCAQDEFRCATGRCIPTDWRCDGDPDCPGREDEEGCAAAGSGAGGGGACSPTYFRCPNGRCIPGRWRCDLDDDCGDGADEMQCAARPCSESEWRCAGGDCVPAAARCDGEPHCADASDEACAACAGGARRCAAAERCVRADWWCDGEPDCPDASDEAACAAPAPAPAAPACAGVPCGGACLPAAWRCDGRRDCADGRDEAGCARSACPPRTLRCADATCLPEQLACDGERDCADGGDEEPALCARRAALGEEPCAPDEHLCPDGCRPLDYECAPAADYDRACPHTACSQLCLPKHDNYTCKCVPGFKQRVLPDGTQTCEAPGERPLLLVATGGVVRVWDLRKDEAGTGPTEEEEEGGGDATRPAVAALTGADVEGVRYAWWGDEAGGLWRRRLAPLGAPELLAREPAAVRGLAVDARARRLYWTVAGTARGGRVRAGTLGARRATTLHAREDAEPDDLVFDEATRRLLWTDRGVAPAVWAMGADGRGARRLLWRRLRRPTALALHAAAARLYVAEAGGALLTVRVAGGGGRAQLPPPARPCARLAVWEEWVWCAGGRGVVRLPRRGAVVGPRRPLAAHAAVTALALVPAAGAGAGDSPCGAGRCDASALCVRSAEPRGYACLCPDGLEPAGATTATDANRTCVISRALYDSATTTLDNGTPQEPEDVPAPATPAPATTTAAPTTAAAPPALGGDDHDYKPHHEPEQDSCGCVSSHGRCVRVAGAGAGAVCACAGAWGGARCDHYVGHDHDCRDRCAPPALCVWAHRPDGGSALSAVYCACPLGATCVSTPPPPPVGVAPEAGAGAGSVGGAWVITLPVLAAITAALLYLLYRRTRSRHGRFGHARLADNVEISNPMYLAGEDEELAAPPPPPPLAHLPPPLHTNHAKRGGGGGGGGGGAGGNHFANPVYESMYSQLQDAPVVEEHATLLSEGGGEGGSPPAPAERAALL